MTNLHVFEADTDATLVRAVAGTEHLLITGPAIISQDLTEFAREFGYEQIVRVTSDELDITSALLTAGPQLCRLALDLGIDSYFYLNNTPSRIFNIKSFYLLNSVIALNFSDYLIHTFPNLRELAITNGTFESSFIYNIAKNLPKLTTLILPNSDLGDAGAQAIAENLTALTSLTISNNSIGDAGAQAIAENLTALTSLTISNNSIGKAGAQAIAENLPALTSLSISDNSIGDAGAQAIAEKLTALKTLSIADNSIGDAGAQAIAESLTALTSLTISLNSIGDAGAQVIAGNLTALTSLSISHNNVGHAGALAIAGSLTALKSLTISSNRIGDVGMQAIAANLTGLTLLDAWENEIGYAGAKAIAENLTELTGLDISENSIGEAGVKAIAENLRALTSLFVWGIDIGDAGAEAIAENLTALTLLDVSFANIGETGAQAIAKNLLALKSLDASHNGIGEAATQAIAENLTALTSLNLAFNSIGKVGAQAIAENLTELTSLNLSYNRIGKVGAHAIAENLTALKSLRLSDSGIGDAGAQAIAKNLTALTSLDLSQNSIGKAGAQAIAENLTALTSLDLSSSDIGFAGAKAIAENLTALRSLDVSNNDIGNIGAKAIAENLTALTSITMSSNGIGEAGAQVIAKNMTALKSLTISANEIGEIGVKAIAENLTALRSLTISNNSVGNAGAQAIAENLTALKLLSMSDNSFGDAGAKAIAESLTALTELDVSSNLIGDAGAKAIAENLTALKSLDLSINFIGDAGAKAIAENLTALKSLDLSTNRIGDAGAKAIAENLTRLSSLQLSKNGIGDVGARAILGEFAGSGIVILDLSKNPCVDHLMTPENFDTSDAKALLAAWNDYERSKHAGALAPLNSAKLLILGEEAVGKTSLVRYLVTNAPRDPEEMKTQGIRQSEKIETTTWRPDGCSIRINVWDFAGQEITHGTHRYFLSERSLYLLVLEDRREDNPPTEKWLRTIAAIAGDAPTIIVINKSDNGKTALRLDEEGLQRQYPQIVGFLRTACNQDDWSRHSIAALRMLIANTLVEDRRLDALRNPVPIHWLAIKDAVEVRAREQAVLQLEEFNAICMDPDIVGDRQLDAPDLRRSLLRMLHEMGVIVAHGLSRDAPAALRAVSLLDPNWLTDAIYSVLNDTRLQERGGRFTQLDLAACLDPDRYPPEQLEFILAMMQDPAIGLCFRLDGSEQVYLAPDALPANSPDFSGWEDGALRFRFRYHELPRPVMTRFIVRMASRLESPANAWRTGVRLKIGPSDVLVRSFPEQRMIDIAIKGDLRRDALAVVRDSFGEIHKGFEELKIQTFVPMPDKADVEEDYSFLLRLEKEEGKDYRHRPTGADRAYSVGELLELVDRRVAKDKPSAAPSNLPQPQNSLPQPSWRNPTIIAPTALAGALAFTLAFGWSVPWRIWILIVIPVWFLYWSFLRGRDRAFMFRRVLVLWVLSGIGLVLTRGASFALNLQWLQIGFGNLDWIAMVGWLLAGLIIAFMAYQEHRSPL
ncbi:small GTP-binding protein [Hoeflea marina]|uniref:non-specific serine/threonine protein kinase n=1 Tax=Hoeflea marina TaxID=274592 RepID=A0A317PQX8_9HYPH|nr:COR domain-containing protein [Hoeflea marina]PWW03579.1 small GTP-binding protein [Hoeflea marina]